MPFKITIIDEAGFVGTNFFQQLSDQQIALGRFVMIGDGHNQKSMAFVTSKSAFERFIAPYELEDGIKHKIDSEFINPNSDREILYT